MHELDMVEGGTVTPDVLREALTSVAMKNGRPVDAGSIDKLAVELLDGRADLSRDELREALSGFSQQLEAQLEQPPTSSPLIEQVMLALEKEPGGEVPKDRVKYIVADILAKEPEADVGQVQELVDGLFDGKTGKKHSTIGRDSLRKRLVKRIPKINEIYGANKPPVKQQTGADLIMRELEKCSDDEISEALLKKSMAAISGKPVDEAKLAQVVKEVMKGNKSVSR